MLVLAFLLSLAAAAPAASGLTSPPFQETGAAAKPAAEPPSQPSLSPEARGTLERLRSTLAEHGSDRARELLQETVAGLADPEAGAELGHIAFLLELDRLAQELGSLEESRRLCESILALRTRILPPEHADVLSAKRNLAATRYSLGNLAGAHELFEEVHAASARLYPPEHPELLRAKGHLAVTQKALGDLTSALALEEEVHAGWSRFLPPDHPKFLMAKGNLAATRKMLGDLAGALALEEEVHASWSRLLPPEHPDLLKSKLNLAGTRKKLGDFAGALALNEEVQAAWTRMLPPEHPHLLAAKGNLAVTRKLLGDLAGALALEEEVHAAWTRLLPPDHPDLLLAKGNLAVTRRALGDIAGALVLEEEVHAARTRLLPPDHPALLDSRLNLAVTRRELLDVPGALALASELLSGVRRRARALFTEATRPAQEGARAELFRLSYAIFLSSSEPPKQSLDPELLATLECLRVASVASSETSHALAGRPDLDQNARDLSQLRCRLSDLVAAAPAEEAAIKNWRKDLVALAEERDRAERKLLGKLAETGAFVGEIDAAAIAGKLEEGTAAVSYLRYTKWFDKDPSTGEPPPAMESLLAFLVQPGGAVRRIELGPAAEIEELVRDWRSSLGKPIERGTPVALDEGLPSEDAGRALRARILDPLLAACGEEVLALHVVLDDVLFLVPLDALPLEKEERMGERLRIYVEPMLARLLRDEPAAPPEGTLVALGGIDFDAEMEPSATTDEVDERGPEKVIQPMVSAATPPTERAGRPQLFEPLRQTLYEVEDVSEQYKEAFEQEPLVLQGASASKAALHAAAPKARFLHLATHGWFASEAFKSQLDMLMPSASAEPWQRAGETLTGFAPETLCGLALAGANKGRDSFGRVPGILTAEELSSFDLRGCELAVLSACETNVGIRRAGQGIRSLQTALHAAGARTAITSLWKVDDAATRRLFELFYAKLWKEKLGKHEALWQAKMALRAEGHPPRDWAAWVLTGAPD